MILKTKGCCQICGCMQIVVNAKLVNHGPGRSWNFLPTRCPGSEHLPFELSIDLIDSFLEILRADALYLRNQANLMTAESGEDSEICYENVFGLNKKARVLESYELWQSRRILSHQKSLLTSASEKDKIKFLMRKKTVDTQIAKSDIAAEDPSYVRYWEGIEDGIQKFMTGDGGIHLTEPSLGVHCEWEYERNRCRTCFLDHFEYVVTESELSISETANYLIEVGAKDHRINKTREIHLSKLWHQTFRALSAAANYWCAVDEKFLCLCKSNGDFWFNPRTADHSEGLEMQRTYLREATNMLDFFKTDNRP